VQVSYQTALGAVFVEGWIFIILAITGIRLRLIRLVPKSIMLATSAGVTLTPSLPLPGAFH
jgi:AGZA family xanthine/uracil permease-like MFS transporter